jgi:hypothetical protein
VQLHLLHAPHAHTCTQAAYPLLYARADSLPLGTVPQLLQEYKEVVLKYEALARVSGSG